jgi:CBS domain-containing protein
VAAAVRDFMTARVVSVRFDDPIATMVERLTRFGFSALPVVTESSRLVGMVSLLDVLRYREVHAAEGVPADEQAPVEVIMNPDVVSMAETANVAVVAQRLRSHGELRVMPIVKGGRLVGVITRSDLLSRHQQGEQRGGLRRLFGGRPRERAAGEGVAALARGRRVGPTPADGTPVEDVMTRQVITAAPADPVARAAELMLSHRHTALPVVDGAQRVVGIVSEADILAAPPATRPGTATVGRVMTGTPITVPAGATVGQARALVADRGLRMVPVLDGGRLVGVLSRSDLT